MLIALAIVSLIKITYIIKSLYHYRFIHAALASHRLHHPTTPTHPSTVHLMRLTPRQLRKLRRLVRNRSRLNSPHLVLIAVNPSSPLRSDLPKQRLTQPFHRRMTINPDLMQTSPAGPRSTAPTLAIPGCRTACRGGLRCRTLSLGNS